MDLTLIYVLYLASNLILPILLVDEGTYINQDPINFVIRQGKLRNFIFYLKIVYFIPFIIVWVVATLVIRLVKFILYKEEK